MFSLFVLACLCSNAYGFPSGAPETACGDMTPQHYGSGGPQTTASSYSLVVSTDNKLKVTISSTNTYKGFLLRVRNAGDGQDTSIGGFTNLPSYAKKACQNNSVTHSTNTPTKSNQTFEWTPPAGYCGTFVYEATVVQSFMYFWTHILSPNVTIDCPETTTTTTTQKVFSLTLDPECSSSKRCFHDCGSSGCNFLVTWRNIGEKVEFEIIFKMSGTVNQYAAIGFSDDKSMSGDSVVGCLYNNGAATVEQSYNPGYYNMPIINKLLGLTEVNTSVEDSYIRCKFKRAVTISGDTQLYNLTTDYYLLFAKGPLSSGYIRQHLTYPSITPKKVSFGPIVAVTATTTTTATTSPSPAKINLDPECDRSKSCFHDCGTSGCTYLVSWQTVGNDIDFEITFLMTKPGDQWVAIAFSSDSTMSADSVIACMYKNGVISAEYSYNPGHYNIAIVNKTRDLNLLFGALQDSVLRCKFRRPLTYTGEPQIYDLNQKWYLFLGNGPVVSGSIGKHIEVPHISPEKLSFGNSSVQVSTTTAGPFTITIDAECGTSKGCFHDCSQSGCTYMVTWHDAGQNVEFDIIAKMVGNGDQWAGIALSGDKTMGDDSVIACMYKNGKVDVEQSYNPDHYNQRLSNPTLGISHRSGMIQDSYIKCHFERIANVANEPKIFDLSKTWYLIFGQGPVNSGFLGKHTSVPDISQNKVSFSSTLSSSSTQSQPTSTQAPSSGEILQDPECSETKGCFDDCENGKCSRLVTWKGLPDEIEFEIKSAAPASGNFWSAIAFSSDENMGDDNVIACLNKNGQVTVQQSYNPGYYNAPITDSMAGITIKTAKLENSVIHCVFHRKKNVTGEPKVFDLSKKWHMLYATGSALQTNALGKHSSKPIASEGTIDFLTTQSVKGKQKPYTLVKVHGSLMIIAWILFASIGIVTARYYKSHWPDSKLLGEKVWFTLHRSSMILTLVCTCAAFMIIFIDVKGYSEIIPREGMEFLKFHPILGIVVTCLTIINPIMALFRPAPDHKKRPIFNILHWLVGTTALILAVITIFFGLQFEKSRAPISATYVMIAYCVTFVIIEVILEIQKYRELQQKEASNTYEMKERGATESRVKSYKKKAALKTWIIYLHILAMFAYTVTIILLILLNKTS